MSRASIIDQLYAPKRKSALEFDYDSLWAPPIRALLTQQDINELYKIATSLKYNDDINMKYKLIDAIMKPRGFKRGNCGTNRVVYNFLESTSFCFKIALDRVGIKDSPAEYKNQEFFKPFCCKIFEVDPSGVVACVERVNPISSLEEFLSVSDDVFNMMVTKIIGKYVVDDLGCEKWMNYGIRYNANGVAFGPVVLDYPYAYELDGNKLHCGKILNMNGHNIVCNGEIDYDDGLNNLVCSKCGKHYTARELARDDTMVIKYFEGEPSGVMRAKIMRKDGTVIKDSGRSSKVYISLDEYEEGQLMFDVDKVAGTTRKVVKKVHSREKRQSLNQRRKNYYEEVMRNLINSIEKESFNSTEEDNSHNAIRRTNKNPYSNTDNSFVKNDVNEDTVARKVVKRVIGDEVITLDNNSSSDETYEKHKEWLMNKLAIIRDNSTYGAINPVSADDSKLKEEMDNDDENVDPKEDDIDWSRYAPELDEADKAILKTLGDIFENTDSSSDSINDNGENAEVEEDNTDDSVVEETEDLNEENNEEESDSNFSEDIEAEVFPEIINRNYGVDHSKLNNFNNGNKNSFTDDDENYKYDRKKKKKYREMDKKNNRRRKMMDDMSDY